MNLKIISLIVTFSVAFPVHASWLESIFNPPPLKNYFVELSYERSKYGYGSYTSIDDGLYLDPGTYKHANNALSFSFGDRRVNNLGTQLSFTQVQPVTIFFTNGNTKQYANSLFIDSLIFVPLWRNLEIKLLWGIGLFNVKFKTIYSVNNNVTTNATSSISMGLRVGAGLQHNITKHLSGNLMYKYQASFDKIKYISGVSLGLVYNFCHNEKPDE